VLHLRSVADALAGLAGGLREIRVSGGFARSAALRQLIADILGRPVVRTDSEDASGVGAARLALHALGLMPDPAASASTVTDRCDPNPELVPVYDRLHGMFKRSYERVSDTFAELDAFRS